MKKFVEIKTEWVTIAKRKRLFKTEEIVKVNHTHVETLSETEPTIWLANRYYHYDHDLRDRVKVLDYKPCEMLKYSIGTTITTITLKDEA